MKTLILDFSKWRAGGDDIKENKIGKGNTQLLNGQGYMCCLGQFSLQLDKNLNKNDIKNLSCPDELLRIIPLLTKKQELKIADTKFSTDAININDNPIIKTPERIRLLRGLLKTVGYILQVKNYKSIKNEKAK